MYSDYLYQDITYKVVFPVYTATLSTPPLFHTDENEVQEVAFYSLEQISLTDIGLLGDREAVREYLQKHIVT